MSHLRLWNRFTLVNVAHVVELHVALLLFPFRKVKYIVAVTLQCQNVQRHTLSFLRIFISKTMWNFWRLKYPFVKTE